MSDYISKATVTSIKASSRASVSISRNGQNNFYTVEYSEERTIPEDADIEKERQLLWDVVNTEVDTQIEDIYKTFKK